MNNADEIAGRLRQKLADEEGKTLLLTGPWGCGKTHLWKSRVAPGLHAFHPIYLSLFGADSIGSVKKSLFSKALLRRGQLLKKKEFKRAWKRPDGLVAALVSKGVGTFVHPDLLPAIDPAQLIEDGLILCLDDLERVSRSLPVEEVLGFATFLAEAKRARVLILANEAHLRERKDCAETIARYRERVLTGHVSATANMKEIYDIFADKFRPYDEEFFARQKRLILRQFENSGVHNLRSLKRVLRDVSELLERVDASRVAAKHVAFLAALRIEADNGRLRDPEYYDFLEMAILAFDEGDSDLDRERRSFYHRYFNGRDPEYEYSATIYELVSAGHVSSGSVLVEFGDPGAAPLSPKQKLLEKVQSRDWLFYGDDEYAKALRDIETLVCSDEVLTTLEIVKLLVAAKLMAERAGLPLRGELSSRIATRLASNADDLDETFGADQRFMYSEAESIWKPYMDGYDARVYARKNEALADALIGLVKERNLSGFIDATSRSPEALSAAVDSNVTDAIDELLTVNREFHYYAYSMLIEELEKWTEETLPRLQEYRVAIARHLTDLVSRGDLGHSDRVRIGKLLSRCSSWAEGPA